ncbi:hypothetical protein EV649_1820 [Kribbella sp. VKM Ac-2569]|uniref:hypothetical protein n=1 Tax=Kribbella sp. VKM Ac-2569 TaxID=2512220 RepID=UPI00102CD70B|nr:hypothetical protein [Kribbella sp. VKM Ac-2569]RZT28044.1 hypothetical protein EV649_1820 [Kribbella sp. VKM Ac-2569]
MSATVESPIVPGPVQGPTREEPLIEALLLDDYRSLVHLAYLILPPAISRARRVAAAHAVVQRALPPGLALPTDLVLPSSLTVPPDVRVPATRHREFMRRRVVEEATRQAERRSFLARLGSALAPADELGFEPCATRPDRSSITRRRARGRRFAIATVLVLTAGILAALLTS